MTGIFHQQKQFPWLIDEWTHESYAKMRNVLSSGLLKARNLHVLTLARRLSNVHFASSTLVRIQTPIAHHQHLWTNSAVNLGELCPADIASAVKDTALRHYKQLLENNPSLQGDPATIEGVDNVYWRLVDNEDFNSAMQSLQSDRKMQVLVELIEQNVENFSIDESVDMLFFLLVTGHHTSPVIPQLLGRTRASVATMDMKSLMLMTRIASILNTDFSLLQMIFKRSQELLEKGKISRNSTNLNAFCSLVLKLRFYTSFTLANRYQDYLLSALTTDLPFSVLGSETFVAVVTSACKTSQTNTAQKQIVIAAKQHLSKCISDLTPLQMAQVVSSFVFQRLYDDSTRKLVDKHVEEFLQRKRDWNVGDTVALYSCLSSRSDTQLVKTLESMLEQKLQGQEIDKTLIKILAASLHKVNSMNVTLIQWVQERISKCVIDKQILPFLTEKEFVQAEHKAQVLDTLFENIDVGKSNKLTAIYILSLLLPLPDSHFQQLLSGVEGWNFAALSRCLEGILKGYKQHQQTRGKMDTRTKSQYNDVEEILYKRLTASVDVSNILATYNTIHTLRHAKKRVSTEYMVTLMNSLCEQAKKVQMTSTKTIHWYLRCFSWARFYDPELCNVLSESVARACEHCTHSNEMEVTALHLLDYLGHCGHVPPNFNQLMPIVEWLLQELDKTDTLEKYLRTILNLVLLEQAPKPLLGSIFTKEFMQRLSEYLMNNPNRRERTYQTLVFLNQCAVLDYPDLGIPWFLEEVARKTHQRLDHWLPHETHCLQKITGGSDYYRKFSFSPYGHLIEFVLLLDRANNLVQWSEESKIKNVRRVAVTVESMGRFCMTGKDAEPRLSGRRQRTIGHLHKLGYTVVQVPYYEWYGNVNYRDYLRAKLNESIGLSLCEDQRQHLVAPRVGKKYKHRHYNHVLYDE